MARFSLNKLLSDNSHGRLEWNGKLIKREVEEDTVTLGKLSASPFIACGQNAKQLLDTLRLDVSADLLCFYWIHYEGYTRESLLVSEQQTNNLDGMLVVSPKVKLVIIVFIWKLCWGWGLMFSWQWGVSGLHLLTEFGVMLHTQWKNIRCTRDRKSHWWNKWATVVF